MNKKIGVAFDLEGTVIDVEECHHLAHLKIAKQLGLNLSVSDAIEKIEHFIGGPDILIMEEILVLSGKSGNSEQLLQEDNKLYKEFLSTAVIKTREGFRECLEELKKNEIALSVGSLSSKDEATYLMRCSGLNKLIPSANIVYRESVKHLKPAQDVFLETAQRMGIDLANQIVFEDSPRGVMSAVNAGSKMVIGMPVYNWPATRNALQIAGAKYIFGSWKEVNIYAIIKELNSL
ncbi:MAG: hypothetical protein COY69_00815 [Candidatus Magasanikbacteria bacterium CG_4_10_14_0_8_um_filter_32_14]|uniref:HAD family phosphatase n=2 Tax=Candidatus Magasanikiibacteriota TaxID=1752731 RepID=A0A2M7RA16_9BACT|nr:MAG: hypothetical protein AUJ23_01210 [Candidatus Magasanikbacteria bacterium CG1_02_32_51]PIY93590.1 MAG: hypothetical protein COY69_00815 [Candidatus Magasanikbacteria bacterium CG_4_10_14_0_8_um_filter_32_14]